MIPTVFYLNFFAFPTGSSTCDYDISILPVAVRLQNINIEMSENKTEIKSVPEEPRKAAPGEGIRSMRSTWAFRAINFELYAKPSKFQTDRVYLKRKL